MYILPLEVVGACAVGGLLISVALPMVCGRRSACALRGGGVGREFGEAVLLGEGFLTGVGGIGKSRTIGEAVLLVSHGCATSGAPARASGGSGEEDAA